MVWQTAIEVLSTNVIITRVSTWYSFRFSPIFDSFMSSLYQKEDRKSISSQQV